MSSEGHWLSKSDVNALFYNTVAGEVGFATEGRHGYQPGAVANLISRQAAARGKNRIRILEVGANDCSFADDLLDELRAREGLERVDYLAVEFARSSLEVAIDRLDTGEPDQTIRRGPPPYTDPPEKPALVALITTQDPFPVNLGLIHAEANQFAHATSERFDFVLLNELLDDMPWRVYFADASGCRFEAVALSQADGERWRVRVDAEPLTNGALLEMPPATITARSEECVELVTAVAGLLEPGGILLAHDYAFADDYPPLELWAGMQPNLPAIVEMEYPPGSEEGFPRAFFRVFANERLRVVQVTNDVNFAELAAALEPLGTVAVLPHGSGVLYQGRELEKGQGTFLAELAKLEPDDDFPALLEHLTRDQKALRDRYVSEVMEGRASAFFDLLFVRE